MARRSLKGIEPKLINQREIARVYGVETRQVLDWAKRSEQTLFPRPVRVCERTWLFRRADVERFFRDHDA